MTKKHVIFKNIGGYELLYDGTQSSGKIKSVKELQEFLTDKEIDFDYKITNLIELAKSVEDEWVDMYDDGGGRGWIEYKITKKF